MDPVAGAFAECERVGWAAVPGAVAAAELIALAAALADLVLEPLVPEAGPVRQAGAAAVCPVAGRPAIEALAGRLAAAAAAAGSPWAPDEAATTRYGPGEGISPHRDNSFYEGFVAVVTLAGRARLRVVADRAGEVELAGWAAGPGHLALVRGPRPGTEARPLHEVGPAGPAGRQVLVLRANRRGAGRGWG
ncbi:MAG: hypothetical protein ABIS47_11065 [Acidimicrobiales bacterium]